MTQLAALARESEQDEFLRIGVAELVALALWSDSDRSRLGLVLLGLEPEVVNEEMVQLGAANLAAQKLIVQDEDGSWSTTNGSQLVAHGFGAATAWVTMQVVFGDGGMDQLTLFVTPEATLMAVPRFGPMYLLAGLDDDGNAAAGIADLIDAQLELDTKGRIALSVISDPAQPPLMFAIRRSGDSLELAKTVDEPGASSKVIGAVTVEELEQHLRDALANQKVV